MKKVEYRIAHYGKCYITIEDDSNDYKCDTTEVYEIFSGLGKRIDIQLAEGITIFKLGNKQIEKVKSFFVDGGG